MARKPNMRLAITPGQETISDSSMADQRRVSSETGRSFGRGTAGFWRIALDFVVLTDFLDRHDCGTIRRQMEFWLGQRLHLFECRVGCQFAKHQALGSDVDEREFCDNVINDFYAGERQGAFFQDFWLVVAGGVDRKSVVYGMSGYFGGR